MAQNLPRLVCKVEDIRVSDHALCRYLERVHGFNMQLIREHILGICGTAAAFGATAVRAEGFKFVIANGVITTVTTDAMSPGAATRTRAQAKIARGSSHA